MPAAKNLARVAIICNWRFTCAQQVAAFNYGRRSESKMQKALIHTKNQFNVKNLI
jgi:hypothetical protein